MEPQQAPLAVFFHTNRPLRNATAAYAPRTGWWASTHDINGERRMFAKSEFPYHSRFALHQARKYEWMAAWVARATVPPPEPWLLADTDTVFQCTAEEWRQRWAQLGSPALLVGAEHKWFPKRDYTHNPWPATPTGLRYPNSGLLLGTQAGFAALRAAYAAMPRYPCCPVYSKGRPSATKCHIDDQHCLLIGLQQRPWRRRGGAALAWRALCVCAHGDRAVRHARQRARGEAEDAKGDAVRSADSVGRAARRPVGGHSQGLSEMGS
jgi:hypothetical protein